MPVIINSGYSSTDCPLSLATSFCELHVTSTAPAFLADDWQGGKKVEDYVGSNLVEIKGHFQKLAPTSA